MPLEAREISFRYGRKSPWILKNFSMTAEKGECIAVSAPSGYGKTTLAMLLSGYLKPEEGSILLDGKKFPKKGYCPVQLIFQHPEKSDQSAPGSSGMFSKRAASFRRTARCAGYREGMARSFSAGAFRRGTAAFLRCESPAERGGLSDLR